MASRLSIIRWVGVARTPGRCLPGRKHTTRSLPITQHGIRQFSALSARQVKYYTEDHEWVELSEDKKTVTLGISSYAANALGDVIYVELPSADLEVGNGDAVGAVESVKSASDILTPVEGKVIAANEKLQEKPALLNQDPEGEGWVCKVEVGDPAQVESLMDADAYKKFTEDSSS